MTNLKAITKKLQEGNITREQFQSEMLYIIAENTGATRNNTGWILFFIVLPLIIALLAFILTGGAILSLL